MIESNAVNSPASRGGGLLRVISHLGEEIWRPDRGMGRFGALLAELGDEARRA